MLEDEDKSIQNFTENYKKKFSEELKKMDPKEIKNTTLVEKKYTIWQRILKTLGIN
jgi:hypothetical protein